MKFVFDKEIEKFISYCKENEIDVYLVGGAIRDYLLNKKTFDYDFALVGNYDKAIEKLKDKYSYKGNEKYQSIKIFTNGYSIEITHCRKEKDYLDYRHPSLIEFSNDIKEDSNRRDFTINALYYKDGKLYDFFDGIKDIENKRLKVIGDTLTRFKEDPLRILRMIRLSSLGFKISSDDKVIINNSLELLQKLKIDSFNSEFDKILMLEDLTILKEYKLLFESYFDVKFNNIDKLSCLDNLIERKTFLGIKNSSNLYKYRDFELENNYVCINKLIYKLGKDKSLELIKYYDKINGNNLIDMYLDILDKGFYSKKQLDIDVKDIIELIDNKDLTSYYIDIVIDAIISRKIKNVESEIRKYILEKKDEIFI